jgi:hypothetical protein
MCRLTEAEFGLVNGFIDHLYTQLRTTYNYSAIADLHNSQITTALAKPLPAYGISGFLYFIHRPVFQGTHDVPETGSLFVLR